jgi:hypothetical protein
LLLAPPCFELSIVGVDRLRPLLGGGLRRLILHRNVFTGRPEVETWVKSPEVFLGKGK